MKKVYIYPVLKIVVVHQQQMICASLALKYNEGDETFDNTDLDGEETGEGWTIF